MAFSTQRAVSDGTLQLLMIEIEFFDKSEITAYFDNIPTTAFIWATDKSLRFDAPVPAGIEVLLRRTTDLSAPRHIFSQGAQFKDSTLDEDFKQILHIAQEAVEGANVGDIYQPLNMHGNPILNVGPAVDDGSAVSLGQVKTESASAWVAANQATAALAGVQASAATATQQAGIATTKAAAAAASEAVATQQAVIATTAVASIGTSVGDAAASAATATAQAGISTTKANESSASAASALASKNAAAISAATADTAGLQLGMTTWGHRAQPFRGFAVDDGQELERALYPDFAAALDAGLFPLTSEADWQANPQNRAYFVANSSSGKFRMRDLNGASSGTFTPGGVFLRGGTVPASFKKDQIQNIVGAAGQGFTSVNPYEAAQTTGAFAVNGNTPGSPPAPAAGALTGSNRITFDASRVVRTGTETFPTHATGAWMTRLYGLITPLGSAEASSLATAYASIASDITNKLNPLWANRFKTQRRSLVDLYNGPNWTVGMTIVLAEDIRNFEFVTARWTNTTTAGLVHLGQLLAVADYPFGSITYISIGVGGAADYQIRFNDIGDGTYRSVTMMAAGAAAQNLGIIKGHRPSAFQ